MRASRLVSDLITEELEQRGYRDVRVTHSAILANLDLEGTRATTVAERALISKQAAGALVQELEDAGYLRREPDPDDGRSKILRFTKRGESLMFEMFDIIEQVEERYAHVLGEQTMDDLRTGLAAMLGASTLSADP